MADKLILGSGSPHRRKMLEDAGVPVEVMRPDIDERAVEQAVANSGTTPAELAEILAVAKGEDVSARAPGGLVIACDQTMALGDRLFHKPKDMEDARRHLLALSGRTHELHSAVVLARDGTTLWSHVATARMSVRELSPAFIGRHLSRVGDKALTSVGAYQVEGEGIQLFERIEGDFFTIVGLPLLPLLAKLRELGAIDG
jgi:septum formation protein